jgi:uncharacterized Fe-S cluster-containing MiaB family protein
LNEIESIANQKLRNIAITLETLEDKVFHTQLSDGQKELLFTILIHSALSHAYIRSFIKEAIFVTEDQDFLSNVYSMDRNKESLTDNFSYLRIVNVERALEIMDLYAKMNGFYFGVWSKRNVTAWYQLHLASKLIHAPVVCSNNYIGISKLPSTPIRSLIFRFLKLLVCKDYLGKQRYFGLAQ